MSQVVSRTPTQLPLTVHRWTAKLKLALMEAINEGTLTKEEALSQYLLSEEELKSWSEGYKKHGLNGLRMRKLQLYRGHGMIGTHEKTGP